MASMQAWNDFDRLIRLFETVGMSAGELDNVINRLKHDKAEILDRPDRKAELKKIIDIHPLYILTKLQEKYREAIDLQKYLVDNSLV